MFEERTITGLVIKAQAMQALGTVDSFMRAFNPHGVKSADAMTATKIRQTAG